MDASADWPAAPTRAQQIEMMLSAAPVFGGRRQWLAYACETTGYGSVELSGTSPHRVTLVRPGDGAALHEHHRLVRAGRLAPTWPRRPLGPDRVHVLDHDELARTRAEAHDSWLVTAQAVARLCGTDDEVARLAGDTLRHVLWSGRRDLASAQVAGTLRELHDAAVELLRERVALRAAVERTTSIGIDLEAIRLEARTLSAVRAEWDGRAVIPPDVRRPA